MTAAVYPAAAEQPVVQKKPLVQQEPIYRIGPSDLLEIVTWREEQLTRKDVLVRPDGRISLPLTDDIMAAGLTLMQLKYRITKASKPLPGGPPGLCGAHQPAPL